MPYARERFFKGGEFRRPGGRSGMQARRWCPKTWPELRIHGTTRRKPLVVFQDEERQALFPWDGEAYEIADWRDRQGASKTITSSACQYSL